MDNNDDLNDFYRRLEWANGIALDETVAYWYRKDVARLLGIIEQLREEYEN